MSVNDFGDFGTCTFMCNANYSEEIIMLQLCFAFLFFHKLQVIHMYASYRFLTYWTHGVLRRGVRKVIPACAVVAKRNAFPSENGRYKGFRYGDDGLEVEDFEQLAIMIYSCISTSVTLTLYFVANVLHVLMVWHWYLHFEKKGFIWFDLIYSSFCSPKMHFIYLYILETEAVQTYTVIIPIEFLVNLC